jgi:diguanylate cyclase (GGDEF)-like protein/PAS domain S-box-containing protein
MVAMPRAPRAGNALPRDSILRTPSLINPTTLVAPTAPVTRTRNATLDLVPSAIFETDAQGQCRYVNRRWQDYAGLSFREALGTGWAAAIHPADRATVVAAWQAAVAAGREFALEFRFLRSDGTILWVAGRASSITGRDGLLTGFMGIVTDVGAVVRERYEQAEQRQFVDAILDIAGTLVCVFDGEGRILRFNRACELLTGYTFDEVRGRLFYEFLVPEAEIAAVREDLARLRPGQLPTQNENNWIMRDGRLRLISWSDACFFDDDGRATHLISTGVDVTDERRAIEAMRGIEAVGTLLATTGPTAESMAAILATLSNRMGYPCLSLFIRRERRFELGAQVGYDERESELDPSSGLVGEVFRTASSASSGDRQIAVPLTADGETVGVLSIESTSETPLTAADVRLIETVAERLAVALVLGRSQQALKERARLFKALNGFAQAAGAMVDETLIAFALLEGIAAVVPHDASWLTAKDRETGRFIVRAVRGEGFDPAAVGREVVPGRGPAGRAIQARAVLTERRPGRHPMPPKWTIWNVDAGALVSIPLIHDQTVFGAIVVGRKGSNVEFSELEHEVLTLLGAQAALAASNAQLLAEVRALAIRDPLTGLYNRRHFDGTIDHIIARWRRDRTAAKPISAIMFDLDHFGLLNNTHGHQAGDAVLREFAGILQTRFRSADLVARYGGEEFVVVLDGATVAEAASVAETIRRDLGSRLMRGPDGQELRATVSAGCAEIDPANATRGALIEAADVALFAAKRAGRNRVIVG